MPEIAEQTALKDQIYTIMSKLAPEHGINLGINEYQKYIDQLLADEFKGRVDASPEEITAVIQLPLFLASVSKDGMKRPEILYAAAYLRAKMLETEFADFKKQQIGDCHSFEEISLYLRFFMKKGIMEDYIRWFEENWRLRYSDSGETSDFWMSGIFMMRHNIRERMARTEIMMGGQSKKSNKPVKAKI
jgi:hypothetical protein